MLLDALMTPENILARNKDWVKPGAGEFATTLMPGEEVNFRKWVGDNKIPFNPDGRGPSDYDMRGFYRGMLSSDPNAASAISPNDNRLHFSDHWKTPYHETFSRESQWATPDAPAWTPDDKLIAKDGRVLMDERAVDPYQKALADLLLKGAR